MIFHLNRQFLTRPYCFKRSLSSFQQIPKHSVYVSNSTNPYFNLSLEDWLFRNKPYDEPLLLLYRDEPCVVIGRNQNPWKEINMPLLRSSGIPFIRRKSGGGTVYHDLGNTNYSIHLPRTSFDRRESAQVVVRAVKSLGVDDAKVNDRNDVCVGEHKIGSAYKIVKNRAYHHGTMLIAAQLTTLGNILSSNKHTLVTKGVASVPSPVCNLQHRNPRVSHTDFVNAVVSEFQKEYDVHESIHWVDEDENTEALEDIQKGMSELSSWQWAFGQTPEFTYALQSSFAWGKTAINVHSKHGIILSCTFDVTEVDNASQTFIMNDLAQLSTRLVGQKYGFLENSLLYNRSSHVKDIYEVLVRAMCS